jgi:hypothetical protein
MQTITNEGKIYLVLEAGETQSPEKRAAAADALSKGTVVQAQGCSFHKSGDNVIVTQGAAAQTFSNTPAQVMDAFGVYDRVDQALATLNLAS